eukprot:CAMPEP_0201725466 /NCGR_PEP_ID=MMETSP0593-20130828/8858_1 /ASSEMBLY_ACC=CAM_ASM_000672 /TAXON_ID=267983 /ORGANISM="Skeletonema japonicum, Strain CCMP2506" /LENGTH=378 /DNA_ID=CAMNT_0048216863 /DNA_START=163 /DNA_END=1296 /DNA_ORIENTATION=+
MRESGVVTSAGHQAVLHDFVASDRKVDENQTATATAADSTQLPGSTTSTKVDRGAEMFKARISSSWRSSSRRRTSSLRFSSFFTACVSSHEDEDLTFCNDASENTATSATITDGKSDVINVNRRSCRRGSSRRFGSFFTAITGDDNDVLLDSDGSNRVEANIAPLRRSVQLTQEEIEYIQNAANDYDHPSQRWTMQSSLSIASSLSGSIHVNGEHDDEGNIQRLEKSIEDGREKSTLPRYGSNTSLNLDEIFDGIEAALEMSSSTFPNPSKEQTRSSDEAAEADVSTNTRRNCTESVNFDPSKSKNNVASKSKKQETFEEQERSFLDSSGSSCNLGDCGWLPWPERRGSIMEGKDLDDNDNSFLPWPESPRNDRALAA